ncbi:hypothetical protein [Sagittula salina]|uniref:Uncharacterized protein n=1 Tax=Sagittula salina TaxID=2820268 RepID=A0A940MN31_9RHOB|nr:hypothetical protein [Sagittula salina]MBP0481538.1 hypothetical protein [Sagittula salina]
MFFLAGLLGMMALGSVVIASTGSAEAEDVEDGVVPSTALRAGAGGDGAGAVLIDLNPAEPPKAEAGEETDGDTGLDSDWHSDWDSDWDSGQVSGQGAASAVSGEPGSLFARLGLINLLGGSADLTAGASAGASPDGPATVLDEAGPAAFGVDAPDVLADTRITDLRGGPGEDPPQVSDVANTMAGGAGPDGSFDGRDGNVLSTVERAADGEDTDGKDFANVGDSHDTITAGMSGVAHAVAGADMAVQGRENALVVAGPSGVADFDRAEDQLLIVYDDSGGAAEPELEIRISATDPAMSEIVLDGLVLTVLPTQDAPALDALVLVGESVAAALALR